MSETRVKELSDGLDGNGPVDGVPTLAEMANCFLAGLELPEKEAVRKEVLNFVQWFGAERGLGAIAPSEVANYAERLSRSDTDYEKKLGFVRLFLAYARKQRWSETNLAVHLKTRKGKPRQKPAGRPAPQLAMTRNGYDALKIELGKLKGRRFEVIDDIRRAAADKDFRENAPLKAAREEFAHIEGRIRELEHALKSAAIVDNGEKEQKAECTRASIGRTIKLRDMTSGEETRYMLVGTKEIDPGRGRISCASPVGKAVMGRQEGEVVEVIVPAGKLRYCIEVIETAA